MKNEPSTVTWNHFSKVARRKNVEMILMTNVNALKHTNRTKMMNIGSLPKVGWVFPMAICSEFRLDQYGDDLRGDTPLFIMEFLLDLISSLYPYFQLLL